MQTRRPKAHRAGTAVAAVLLLAGALTGCSMFDDGDSSDSASGSSGQAGGEAAVDTTGDAVVQATVGSPPQAPRAELDIAIMGIQVRGKLATLTVQMTPRIPAGQEQEVSPYDLNGRTGLDTALIDPVNLKRYLVVRDSNGHEMQTDQITTDLASGKTGTLNFNFAAPPENVRQVDVQIGSWPRFRNIPVER